MRCTMKRGGPIEIETDRGAQISNGTIEILGVKKSVDNFIGIRNNLQSKHTCELCLHGCYDKRQE